MKWTEAMIRKEIQRLDEMTGLHGNDLIVDFGNAKHRLGCFVTREGKSHKFRFSRKYFEDENFSKHEAYDVIRHEYAHYMNQELNGDKMDGGHGEMWKECCRRVGARPNRYYDPAANDIYLRKEREETETLQTKRDYVALMKVGDKLLHPKFGLGEIRSIENTAGDARLKMVFPSGEMKTISAKWLADMCKGVT